MVWIVEPARSMAAALLIVAYAGLCLWAWRRAAGRPAGELALRAPAGWTIAYASQTGTAQALAQLSAKSLEKAEPCVHCLPLGQLSDALLAGGGRFLFIVSTAGQGDPPDNAAHFAETVLGRKLDLAGVEFALLALGDRSYPQFCGFARRLERWLLAQGARRCFDCIDVDGGDPEAIANWQERLLELGGADEFAAPAAAGFLPWKLVHRRHLNAGSAGGEVHHLVFEPLAGPLPAWSAGDLARIRLPGDGGVRDYSIASIPDEGGLHLLVRRHRHSDGTTGAMSGWLTGTLGVGEEVFLHLRDHPGFRLNDNRFRPIVFIGNGVGLAGLRGHLAARIATGIHDNWLIFGERSAACDFHWRREIDTWHAEGALRRLDAVFSRDAGDGRYVQDGLAANGQTFREWIARGAAVYVCGSRQGMAEGVEGTIRELLGNDGFVRLQLDGRYCRDVF